MPVKRCIDFCPVTALKRAAVTKSENGISHRTIGIHTPDGIRLMTLNTNSEILANNGQPINPFAIACDKAVSVLKNPHELSSKFTCDETGGSVFLIGRFAGKK